MRTPFLTRSTVALATLLALGGCDSGQAGDASSASLATSDAAATASATMPTAGRPLATTLTGAEEVPGPGDPDGAGMAMLTVNVGLRQLCYDVQYTGVAPIVAAHIHRAPAGSAGPVVIPLATGGAAPTGFSGCTEGVDRALLRAVMQDPSAYYVNVHNPAFPAGALRGQLGD